MDLITLGEYKAFSNIKGTESDNELSNIIQHISALVENYCDRKFLEYYYSNVTEWFDGNTNVVYLSHFPLVEVVSVDISTDGGITQTTLVENDSTGNGYFIDYQNDAIRTQNVNYMFTNSYNTPYRSVEVVYKAGYSEIPDDLKLALFNMVEYYYKEQYTPGKALAGATIDNASGLMPRGFPNHIRRVLDLYRKLI